MAYLVAQLYPWMLVALLSGILIGALLWTPHDRADGIALTTCALILALGLAAAWTAVAPGRLGLSLEILLAMAIPYGLGWAVGDGFRRRKWASQRDLQTLEPAIAVAPGAPRLATTPSDFAVPDKELASKRDAEHVGVSSSAARESLGGAEDSARVLLLPPANDLGSAWPGQPATPTFPTGEASARSGAKEA